MGHAHVVTNMVDYGMDVQAAIDAPRVFFDGERHGGRARRAGSDVDGPEARGHSVVLARRPVAAAGRRSSSTGSAAC